MYHFYYKENGVWYKSQETFSSELCSRIKKYFYPNHETTTYLHGVPGQVKFEEENQIENLSLLWQSRMVTSGKSYIRTNKNQKDTAFSVYLGLYGYNERHLGYYYPLVYQVQEEETREVYMTFRFVPTNTQECKYPEEAVKNLLKLHSYYFLYIIGLQFINTIDKPLKFLAQEVKEVLQGLEGNSHG